MKQWRELHPTSYRKIIISSFFVSDTRSFYICDRKLWIRWKHVKYQPRTVSFSRWFRKWNRRSHFHFRTWKIKIFFWKYLDDAKKTTNWKTEKLHWVIVGKMSLKKTQGRWIGKDWRVLIEVDKEENQVSWRKFVRSTFPVPVVII